MTTLTVNTVTVVGTSVTIVGTLSSQTFPIQNQQTSIGDIPALNTNWSRNVQISSQGIFCKRYGAQSFAMLLPSFSEIAYNVNASLTFAPYITLVNFLNNPVAHPTNTAIATNAVSELPMTYQWQVSLDGGTTWNNCTDAVYAGTGTSSVLIISVSTGLNGYKYRCQVTNAAGTTTSPVGTLTVT